MDPLRQLQSHLRQPFKALAPLSQLAQVLEQRLRQSQAWKQVWLRLAARLGQHHLVWAVQSRKKRSVSIEYHADSLSTQFARGNNNERSDQHNQHMLFASLSSLAMYSFDNILHSAWCDDYVSSQTIIILGIYSHFTSIGLQEEKQLSVHTSFHPCLLSLQLNPPTFRHTSWHRWDGRLFGNQELNAL